MNTMRPLILDALKHEKFVVIMQVALYVKTQIPILECHHMQHKHIYKPTVIANAW